MEMFIVILKSYLKNTPKSLQDIEQTINDKDYKQIHVLAHGFKGILVSIGDKKVSKIARDMEILSKEKDEETVRRLFSNLVEENDKLTEEIKEWLRENDPKRN